jgi:hypothetical protein
MIRFLKITALVGGFLLPIQLSAQNDFGLWTGVDFRYKATKQLDFGFQVQGRFKSNVSEVDQTFLSPYVRYELHDHIRVGLDYRLSNRPESGLFGERNVHRVTMDLEFKDLLKPFADRLDLDTRIRYTHATRPGEELNNDNLRFRLKLSYNLPKTKLTPHIATEFFYHFNDQIIYTPTEVRAVHRFNKYRLRAGLSYPLNKQHELSMFYMVEPEIESFDRDYVLSLGYSFTFGK